MQKKLLFQCVVKSKVLGKSYTYYSNELYVDYTKIRNITEVDAPYKPPKIKCPCSKITLCRLISFLKCKLK